jgi:hypothetical protein
MPRYAPNKMPAAVKRRYFQLIRSGRRGSVASQMVGVSLSCGSLWFIDAGSVDYVETPISSRYLSQDDRIEIADGLARDEPVKAIAARIGKSYQSVYREIARNRKADGRYQPWYAHNQVTCVGGDPNRAASPSSPGFGSWSRRSWTTSGRRHRSVAGCGAATAAATNGTYARKPSTKLSTEDSSALAVTPCCTPVAATDTAEAGAVPVTEPSGSPPT